MKLDFSESEDAFRRELRSFLDSALPDTWTGVWTDPAAQQVSDDVTAEMARRGWLTRMWPKSFGGADGSIWEQLVIQEELFAAHEPRGSQYMGVNWLGPVLMEFGSAEQQDRYLAEISRGEAFWAQLFSEPDAGSDLAAVRTHARLEGDHFIVNGEKIWTSYANTARNGFLLARTDREAHRHRGLSVLLIDMDTPGITVREIPSVVGWHRFHGVSFEDVRIPRSALLGELNKGWEVAMTALPYERVGNARYARTTHVLGLLERHLATTGGRAPETLADTLALGRAAELLNYRAASAREDGNMTWEASAAFAANAVYEQESARHMEDVLGFSAYVGGKDDHAISSGEVESFFVKQAPTVTIQAGTYQVQLSVIGRQALGLPRSA